MLLLVDELVVAEDGISYTGTQAISYHKRPEAWFQRTLVQVDEGDTRLVLNPERMDTLRIGAQCLDEVIKNQVQAIEDAEQAKRREAANKKAAATKVWS